MATSRLAISSKGCPIDFARVVTVHQFTTKHGSIPMMVCIWPVGPALNTGGIRHPFTSHGGCCGIAGEPESVTRVAVSSGHACPPWVQIADADPSRSKDAMSAPIAQ